MISTATLFPDIREQNNDYAWRVSRYLNESPGAIHRRLMEECDPEHLLSDERLYFTLLSSFLGYNPDENEADAEAERCYLERSLMKADASIFQENPYWKEIVIPYGKEKGNWQFQKLSYQPYELFVMDDILYDEETSREIPQIAYFDTMFEYPMVEEKGREWMAIKPSEICSMEKPLQKMHGNIVVFGLGLGYFPYMASRMEQVGQITIVEKNKDVMDLFHQVILPQFGHGKKITLVCDDAFHFMQTTMTKERYDCAFVDLWHDALDGLPLYLRAKRMEHSVPNTEFYYWMENTLLSAYRWRMFDSILKESGNEKEMLFLLSKESLLNRMRREY